MRTDRISNRLIQSALLTGLIYRIYAEGTVGVLLFFLYITIPVILLFILFLMHALGAGDIKLLSVICSICNIKEITCCIIASFLAGAIMALIKMLMQKNLYVRLSCLFSYVRELTAKRTFQSYSYGERYSSTIHFSISILIGYLVSLGVCH